MDEVTQMKTPKKHGPIAGNNDGILISGYSDISLLLNALNDSMEYRAQHLVEGARDAAQRRIYLERRDRMRELYDTLESIYMKVWVSHEMDQLRGIEA